jgi:hypothetical protein
VHSCATATAPCFATRRREASSWRHRLVGATLETCGQCAAPLRKASYKLVGCRPWPPCLPAGLLAEHKLRGGRRRCRIRGWGGPIAGVGEPGLRLPQASKAAVSWQPAGLIRPVQFLKLTRAATRGDYCSERRRGRSGAAPSDPQQDSGSQDALPTSASMKAESTGTNERFFHLLFLLRLGGLLGSVANNQRLGKAPHQSRY